MQIDESRDKTLDQLDLVAIDVETTGLDAPHLVEIAAVRRGRTNPSGELWSLVDPPVPIPRAATRCHGLSKTTVAGAPRASTALSTLLSFCGSALWLAHNAAFDLGAIADEAYGVGIALPPCMAIDTLRLSRRCFPSAPSYRLSSLARFLDLPRRPAHRALPDARATLALFERCIARLGDNPRLRDVLELHGPPGRLAPRHELLKGKGFHD